MPFLPATKNLLAVPTSYARIVKEAEIFVYSIYRHIASIRDKMMRLFIDGFAVAVITIIYKFYFINSTVSNLD